MRVPRVRQAHTSRLPREFHIQNSGKITYPAKKREFTSGSRVSPLFIVSRYPLWRGALVDRQLIHKTK